MPRDRLPNRRRHRPFDFEHGVPGGKKVAYRGAVGYYPDGRIAEVFLSATKVGTDVDVATKDAAVLLSFALQHGAPFEDLRQAMTRDGQGRPEGAIGTLLDIIATFPQVTPWPPKGEPDAPATPPDDAGPTTGGASAAAVPAEAVNDDGW